MDVRPPADAKEVVRQAVEKFGRLDSIVCNAGIGVFGGILDDDDEQLAAIVETNLLGTVWAVRAAVEHFDERGGGGDLVVLASVAGLGSASGQESVYASSKYGQVGLAISLDRELRPRGIRVSTIAPAAVNTGFADGLGRTEGDPIKDTYLSPDDVAFAVVTVLRQPRRILAEAGTAEVLVADAHGTFRNLLPDDLDQRARLIRGRPSPFGMVTGHPRSRSAPVGRCAHRGFHGPPPG